MEKAFIKAVAEMRRLQKLYFKQRSSPVLKAAKVAEKEVDETLYKLLGIGPDGQPVQASATLFDPQPDAPRTLMAVKDGKGVIPILTVLPDGDAMSMVFDGSRLDAIRIIEELVFRLDLAMDDFILAAAVNNGLVAMPEKGGAQHATA